MTTFRELLAHYREIEKRASASGWHPTRVVGCNLEQNIDCGDGIWTATAFQAADRSVVCASRNLFAALLDVAEAAENRRRGEVGPILPMYEALDRLREAMEANRG